MSAFWYYAEGADTIGPVAFDELVKMLSLLSDARSVLVWRDGFADWKAAETVREIAEKLFRPPPVRPPPPKPPADASPDPRPSIAAPAPAPAEANPAPDPKPKPSKEEAVVDEMIRAGTVPQAHAVANTSRAGLSRSKIALLFFLYFIAAVGLAAFETQPAEWTPFTVWYVVGGGAAIYVMGGILPMIGWAFVGFRAKSAPGPFVIWAVLSLASAVFLHIGNAASSNEKISQAMSKSTAELESILIQAENVIRPTLPKKIDESTTLVEVGHAGTKMRYQYVFDSKNLKMPANFSSAAKTELLPNICSSMSYGLEVGATYEYTYRDRMGALLGSFIVTRADCIK